jgi:hypothetical protein
MGSVVQATQLDGHFDRKLRMLRTPLYCLMAVSRCVEFFEE